MFEKGVHQIDSKNKGLLLSANFAAKFELVFVLTLENALSQRFHFKANRKSKGCSKKHRNFENSPPFQRLPCFYVTIIGNFERFQYPNSETNFLDNENLLKNWSIVFWLKVLRLKTYIISVKNCYVRRQR